MFNQAISLEGFVTKDPEYKKTKTGKSLCTFSIAMNHSKKDDPEKKVSFIDIETWDKFADLCSDHIHKGRRILISGDLRQDRWDGSDGKMRSKIKLVGSQVRFIESMNSEQINNSMAM